MAVEGIGVEALKADFVGTTDLEVGSDGFEFFPVARQ